MQSGIYYQNKFLTKANQRGEDVLLLIRVPGTPCPGAFNPWNNEFDPNRDREYHAANPLEPLCDLGYVGETLAQEEVKAFVGFNLTKEMIELLGPDEFRQGDIAVFYPYTVDLADVEGIEYPIGSGKQYGIYKSSLNDWNWDNEKIYQFTFCRILTTSGSNP